MRRAQPRCTKIFCCLTLLKVMELSLAMIMPLIAPLSGIAQVAGPGSEKVENQPGYAKPPARPPRPHPKEPTDAQVKAIVEEITEAGVLHPQTVEQVQQAYRLFTKFAGPPESVFRVENVVVPGPAGSVPVRVYIPRPGGKLPLWIFFHGGGFVAGNVETADVTLRAVANRCDCAVVSVGYRLAPRNPYPAAIEDAYAATVWAANHATEIGGDPARIALGGDGAGGNLATVVALIARDRNGPHFVSQILIYPILSAVQTTYSWLVSVDPVLTSDAMLAKWGAYIPFNVTLKDPYISPVNSSNLRNLPPTLIVTDENDPVEDDVEQFMMALSNAGVPTEVSVYPNAIHGFFLMAGVLDAGKKAIDQIASSLRTRFNPDK